jgi:hypothetical protein
VLGRFGGTESMPAKEEAVAEAAGRKALEDRQRRSPLWTRTYESYILTAAFSRDGQKILTGDDGDSVRLREVGTGFELSRLIERGPVLRAKFVDTGRRYLTVSQLTIGGLWVAGYLHERDDLVSELCWRVMQALSRDE